MAEQTFTQFASDISLKYTDKGRLTLARQLEKAGLWKGKVSGKFDTNYYEALERLEQRFALQKQIDKSNQAGATADSSLKAPAPKDRFAVIDDIIASGGSDGSGSQRVPSRSVSYDRPEIGTTQAIANAAYQNSMGRDASPAEIKQVHEKYLKFAAKNPTSSSTSMAVVDESGAVTANQSTSVSTGTSERDFIDNLVSGNAEAKAYNAASTYLDGMMQEMSRFAGGI
jgi:hypothetical protein